MKKIALIPARYAATRFPYKLMQPLGGKSVIRHTYDNTLATNLFDEVFVVTDHEIIFNEITNQGGKALRSKKQHESGSDRIAEAIKDMEADIVLNVQGDEPFVSKNQLAKLLTSFEGEAGAKVQVASLMKKFTDPSLAENPNLVKLVVDENNFALYFSRSPIPFYRNKEVAQSYFEHIGVYAFRKQTLLNFTSWSASNLEKTEMLEQLRYLEHGIKIKMIEVFETSLKIDVPEDLIIAENYLKNLSK